MRKAKVVYHLYLLEGRGKKGQCDLVCGAPLDDCANAGLCTLMTYSHGECGFNSLESWSYSKE